MVHALPYVPANAKEDVMRRQDDRLKRNQVNSQLQRSIILAGTILLICFKASAQAAQPTLPNPTSGRAQPVRRIVVSIPDRKLALIEDGRVVRIYHVAVGAPATPSPAGQFTIVDRVLNPTYYKPGVMIQTGPSNPLGTRWIGLSAKGFGIHGTNKPRSIGQNASHGCIRLRNEDIEDLFERVRSGDIVELARERNSEIAQLFSGSEPSFAQSENMVLVAQTAIQAPSSLSPNGQE
jgi:hypothetical protein